MNIPDAKRLARELMNDHGLQDWTFDFDNAKKRFGHCVHDKKLITTSFYLTVLNDEDQVKDVILHEIAHALVGHDAGHDPVWKAAARSIGASDSRTYDSLKVETPPGKWTGTCDNCGTTSQRHRAPKGRISCAKCNPKFDPRYLIRWEKNG